MKMIVTILSLFALLASSSFAHCQIPCGIYDDAARIAEMKEHVVTIEKSMNEISKLTGKTAQEQNQLVRWVNNKEAHADKLNDIVTDYFLSQRIKSSAENYEAKLKNLHAMMVTAMNAKQYVDLEQVAKLRALIEAFEHLYFGETAQPHE